MSWLWKVVSTIRSGRVEQVAEEVLDAVPTAQCFTAGPAPASEPAVDEEDENPTKQRRYFVKRGVFVDHDDEVATQPSTGSSVEEIPDKRPIDLKSIFPKLSLR